jgi:hypothetical protein
MTELSRGAPNENDAEALDALLVETKPLLQSLVRYDVPTEAGGCLSKAGFRSFKDVVRRFEAEKDRLLVLWLSRGSAVLVLGERWCWKCVEFQLLDPRQYKELLVVRVPPGKDFGYCTVCVKADNRWSDGCRMASDVLHLLSVSAMEDDSYKPEIWVVVDGIEPRWLSELVKHDALTLRLAKGADTPEYVPALASATDNDLEMAIDCTEHSDVGGIGDLLGRNVGPSDLTLDNVGVISPEDFRRLGQGFAANSGKLRKFEVDDMPHPLLEAFVDGLRGGSGPPLLRALTLRTERLSKKRQEPLSDAAVSILFATAAQCHLLSEVEFEFTLHSPARVMTRFLQMVLLLARASDDEKSIELTSHFPYRACHDPLYCKASSDKGELRELLISGIPTFELEFFAATLRSGFCNNLQSLHLNSWRKSLVSEKLLDEVLDAAACLPSLTELRMWLVFERCANEAFLLRRCLRVARRSSSLTLITLSGLLVKPSEVLDVCLHFCCAGVRSKRDDEATEPCSCLMTTRISSCLLVNSYREKAAAVVDAPYRAGLLYRALARFASRDLVYMVARRKNDDLPVLVRTSVDLVYLFARRNCDVLVGGGTAETSKLQHIS